MFEKYFDLYRSLLLRHRWGWYFVIYSVHALSQWSTRTLQCKYAIFTSFRQGESRWGRGVGTESHREVLIHKMPQLGNRTPGHVGEWHTDWLESKMLPWKQAMQPYEAHYFSLSIDMLQLIYGTGGSRWWSENVQGHKMQAALNVTVITTNQNLEKCLTGVTNLNCWNCAMFMQT